MEQKTIKRSLFIRKVGVFILVIIMLCTFASCTNKSNFNDVNGENNTNIALEEETTAPLHETEVPEGYIGIYSVDDFEYIHTNPNYNYIMMNDIDFTDVNDWENMNILGNFDGNNYSIMNYKSKSPLFNRIGGSLCDLSLQNVEVNAEAVLCEELCIVGSDESGKGIIENCTISGNLNYSLDSFMLDHIDNTWNIINLEDVICSVGGIVGETTSEITEINNCSFNGNINVLCDYGNISDKLNNNIDLCFANESMSLYIGGIVGYNGHQVKISNCKSEGNITLNAEKLGAFQHIVGYAGGISGRIIDSLIENSANKMSINSDLNIGAGGIAGLVRSWNSSSQIISCSNLGNVNLTLDSNGFSSAGGIIGKVEGTHYAEISNCYNCGNIASDISGGICGQSAIVYYCYNAGNITGNSKTGALLGEKNETIEYCYYLDTGIDVTGEGGKYPYVKELTAEEMTNQNSFDGFDFENVWEFSDSNYNYPTLRNLL